MSASAVEARDLERTAARRRPVPLGDPALDAAFPRGGLSPAGLHEILPAAHRDMPAALGFAAMLTARLLARDGQSGGLVLWCYTTESAREFGLPFGPGLTALGLDPDRLILAEGRRAEEVQWAVEEGLRCADLTAIVAIMGPLPARLAGLASRRLQLAAETAAMPLLGLTCSPQAQHPTALTRLRIAAVPSARPAWAETSQRLPASCGLGPPRLCLGLERCRGGTLSKLGQQWEIEWHDPARGFRVVSLLGDRSLRPPSRGAASRGRHAA